MAEKARPFVWLNGEKKQAEAGMDLAPLASGTDPGFMSAADKAKLDELDPDASGFEFHQSVDQTLYWFESAVNLFRITTINPTSGDEAGGTEYTITGIGLRPGDPVTVLFGATEDETATVDNSTTITGTTPAGTGTVDVTVTQGADSDTLTGGFKYLWTPSKITTALWLDADDSGTITTDGSGNVTQWDDKSGNDRHATLNSGSSSAALTTQNGLDCIDLNNAAYDLPSLGLSGSDNRSFIAVESLGSSDDGVIFSMNASSTTSGERWTFRRATSHQLRVEIAGAGATSSIGSSGVRISGASLNGSTLGDHTVHSDGVSEGLSGGSSVNTVDADNAIGRRAGGLTLANGKYCECVLLPRAWSENEREKLEGYLAHKWGLESNLPGGHPYKDSPP